MKPEKPKCNGCGEDATGKYVYSKHFVGIFCKDSCMNELEQLILARGGGGGGGGGFHGGGGGGGGGGFHGGGGGGFRGGGGGFRGGGFRGGGGGIGHRGFSHYYGRYYGGFRSNPLWFGYPWYRYYLGFPPYSPFWYLVSLYPPGNPFWNNFGYYPPNDPYWNQYAGAVLYQSSNNTNNYASNLSASLNTDIRNNTNNETKETVTFTISQKQQDDKEWLFSENKMQHLKQGQLIHQATLSPSLWNALLTLGECTGESDWLKRTLPTDIGRSNVRMALGAREFDLISYGAEAVRAEGRDPHLYNAMDFRSLLSVVQGSTERERVQGTQLWFHQAVQRAGREEGTLVMASGHVYRYRVESADAPLSEKLQRADRVKSCQVSQEDLQQLSTLAGALLEAPYTINEMPQGHATKHKGTLLASYVTAGRPALVLAHGRIQQHYDRQYEHGLALAFRSLYKQVVPVSTK